MRRLIGLTLTAMLLLTAIAGCDFGQGQQSQYITNRRSFLDTFNTVVEVVGFTKSTEEFDIYFAYAQSRFQELHRLFDIYNSYEGLNNAKTINDKAGIQPVEVDKDLIDLVVLSKEWALTGPGRMNIAMGPVLKIWHNYRTHGTNSENPQLPPMERLQEALKLTDINKVIVDTENNTIFLAQKGMSIDLGAIGKGFAAELVAREIEAMGLKAGAINAGGNVRTIGTPVSSNDFWTVRITDPDSEREYLDRVFIGQASVVPSGDYQRYYYVDGVAYHHLIDPTTLMPAKYFRAVTVVTPDSGFGDLVSTELFLLPYEESRRLAESLEDVEAHWVMPDGEVRFTEGMRRILESEGAKNTK
jgi:thiamine biosynthesis lipoprotein